MAEPQFLRIVRAETTAPGTRELELERTDGGVFERTAGKYLIVHTGVTTPEGRAVKRAYSLLPAPEHAPRRRIWVKWLEGGIGSALFHDMPVGAELSFSGPWGKLLPGGVLDERTLIVATDTGITAALGVVEQAERTVDVVEVLWFRSEDELFPGDARAVAARVERTGARLRVVTAPPVSDESRVELAWRHVAARVTEITPSLILAAGDGRVVHPLRDRYAEGREGVRETRIECFFKNPERKSG